jgi:hypothetical protein
MLVPVGALFVAGAIIWAYGRVRAESGDPADRHGRALGRLAAATIALALVAAVMVLVRAG